MERDLLNNEIKALEFQFSQKTPIKIFEESINGNTCYVEIDLGLNNERSKKLYKKCIERNEMKKCIISTFSKVDGYPEKMTAIYVPDNFKSGSEPDLIIYLHGYLGGHPGLIKDENDPRKVFSPTILDYLNYKKEQYFNFREIINESGKNIILVAPTLGPRSQYGNLASNFDSFMEQIIQSINIHIKKQLQTTAIKFGKIIIAAHSGGGAGMLAIASNSKSAYSKQIHSYWGFDSWYNDAGKWNKIAQEKAAKGEVYIHVYYFSSKSLPNQIKDKVFIKISPLDHFKLLPHYFKERINNL